MTEQTITIRVDDEVLFRLREGCRPLVYPDMITRISYDTGISVLHMGTVWGIGELDGVMALELEDSTIVAADDVDPDSLIVNPTAGMREAVEG